MSEPITNLPDAVAALGSLPMPMGPDLPPFPPAPQSYEQKLEQEVARLQGLLAEATVKVHGARRERDLIRERVSEPFGCTHCGVEKRSHGRRYLGAVGMHAWERPTDEQVKTRMLARRMARVPLPPHPEIELVLDELTGANLSLYEEELLTARLRLALSSAQRGRRELRAGVAETKGALVAAVKAAEGSVVELRREHEENARLRAQISELETERRVTNEALDDAVQELRRRDAPPSQAKPTLSTEAAVIVAAGPLCSCIRFPAAHRADMHDENWQVRDIEPIPSEGWSQMKHAKCTRCGWISKDSWLRFDNWVIQTRIAEMHRHRWTDECLPDAGSAPSLEDPHDGPLAHTYRLGRDLPEMGSV